MSGSERVAEHERGEDFSPATLFNRFETMAQKLIKIWDPLLVARHARDGWDFDDQIILRSGEAVRISLNEYPVFNRNSGKLPCGSIVTGDPESDDDSTYYNFARQLGDITQPNTPLITTYEQATDGQSTWVEDRDLGTDPEALSNIAALLTEIETAIDFRMANPIETIPTASDSR